MIAYHHTIGIAAELGSGCAILQIIFAVMFGHPGAFNEGIKEGIIEVFAKTLPAIAPGFKQIHFLAGAFGRKGFAVNFYPIQRIPVAAAIVHVQLSIIIQEKVRVPATDFK